MSLPRYYRRSQSSFKFVTANNKAQEELWLITKPDPSSEINLGPNTGRLINNSKPRSIWKDSGQRITCSDQKQQKISLKQFQFLLGSIDARSKYLPLHLTLSESEDERPILQFSQKLRENNKIIRKISTRILNEPKNPKLYPGAYSEAV